MGYAGLDLSGRLAVIIGGTSGIGRAIARGLAQAGASVVATGRRGALVESIAGEIEELGRRTLRQTADVTDPASLDALLAACERLAPVDILVNSAGITARAPTVSVSDADWERILETNLTGTLRRGYGRIINVASLTASVGFYEVAAYAASKAGVAALTRSLAVEWGSSGVCVNALVPGVFRTPLNEGLLDGTARGRELLLRTPMHRFGHPDELVGAAIFLASESASFVTGHLLAVDGGFLASGVNQ